MTAFSLGPQLEHLEPLLAHCRQHHFTRKSMIVSAGDISQSLFLIVQGSVTIVLEESDNQEVIIGYLNQGSFFGELGLFSNSTELPIRSAAVRAKTPCKIAEISYAEFRAISAQYPSILDALLNQMANSLRTTTRKVVDLTFLDVSQRVTRALLDLAKQPDAMTHPDGMQIKISRQDIGRLVGCSREMAGRALKKLAEQNCISVKGQSIVIFGTR